MCTPVKSSPQWIVNVYIPHSQMFPSGLFAVTFCPLLYLPPWPSYHSSALCHSSALSSHFLELKIDITIQYVLFSVQPLSLSINILRFIYVFLCHQFLCHQAQHGIAQICYNLFIHSSVNGHLPYFQFLFEIKLLWTFLKNSLYGRTISFPLVNTQVWNDQIIQVYVQLLKTLPNCFRKGLCHLAFSPTVCQISTSSGKGS